MPCPIEQILLRKSFPGNTEIVLLEECRFVAVWFDRPGRQSFYLQPVRPGTAPRVDILLGKYCNSMRQGKVTVNPGPSNGPNTRRVHQFLSYRVDRQKHANFKLHVDPDT